MVYMLCVGICRRCANDTQTSRSYGPKMTLYRVEECVVYGKLSKELKNGIEILVDQAVFKLWIKQSKCCLDQ